MYALCDGCRLKLSPTKHKTNEYREPNKYARYQIKYEKWLSCTYFSIVLLVNRSRARGYNLYRPILELVRGLIIAEVDVGQNKIGRAGVLRRVEVRVP